MKNLLNLIIIFFISFDSDASFIEYDNDLKDVIKNFPDAELSDINLKRED